MFIDFYLDCSRGAGVLGDRLSMNHGHCPPHLKLRDSWTWTRWIAHDPGMPISSSQCFVDMGCAVFECQGRRKWGYPNDGPWIWDAHPIRTTVQILRASPMVCFLDGYSARYYYQVVNNLKHDCIVSKIEEPSAITFLSGMFFLSWVYRSIGYRGINCNYLI